MLQAHYINNSNRELETKILNSFKLFCLKSPPLEEFMHKTLRGLNSIVEKYYRDYFIDNLCHCDEEVKRFAIYGFGLKWLETNERAKGALSGKKVAVMIMGVSFNRDLKQAIESMALLRESFIKLKEENKIDVIAWNQNRLFKKKPFEKMAKLAGGSRLAGDENVWCV